jgi:hypothetical protein
LDFDERGARREGSIQDSVSQSSVRLSVRFVGDRTTSSSRKQRVAVNARRGHAPRNHSALSSDRGCLHTDQSTTPRHDAPDHCARDDMASYSGWPIVVVWVERDPVVTVRWVSRLRFIGTTKRRPSVSAASFARSATDRPPNGRAGSQRRGANVSAARSPRGSNPRAVVSNRGASWLI